MKTLGRTFSENRIIRLFELMSGFLVVLSFLVLAAPSFAQERINGVAYPEPTDRFGRMIFDFDRTIKHEVEMTPGVLVIRFEEPVNIDLSQLPDRMSRYIGAARLDPDGKAIRLALSQALVVNKMEAGEKIFVDLLPSSWQGLPPPLPQEVVEELARRAEEAERKAFLEAERKRRLANAPKMAVRVSEAPTFSRVSFVWSTDVEATVSRERDFVKVQFNTEIKPDISRLTGQPPKNIVSAKWERIDGGTIIYLEVGPDVQVRSFREENAHVIDLSPPPATVADAQLQKNLDILDVQEELAPEAQDIFSLDTRKPEASVAEEANQPSEPEITITQETQPLPSFSEQTANQGIVVPNGPAAESNRLVRSPVPNANPVFAQNPVQQQNEQESVRQIPMAEPANPTFENTSKPQPANPVAQNPVLQNSASANPVFTENDLSNRDAFGGYQVGGSESRGNFQEVNSVRVGNSLRLTIPFDQPVPAAVFSRAGRLWAVFDSTIPFDTRSLRGKSQNFLTEVETRRIGDVQVITGRFVNPALVTASKVENDWVITIGDMILEPTQPVSLVRGTREDGGSLMAAEADGLGNVYWLEDTVVGDSIAVVTLQGPPRGFLKDQSFVEFNTLATAHGMAFIPKTEDLAVRLSVNQVVITREDGLTLSGGGVHQYVPGRKSVGYGARSGQLEYTELVAGNPRVFFGQLSTLMRAAATAEPEDRTAMRMDVARFLVANNYIHEALGVMRMAALDDPLLEQDPAFNIVRGVARTLAGRVEEARVDLSVHGLDKDPDAALWRALLAVEEGKYREAQLLMEEGKFALNSYPAHVRVRFHLAAVEADVATNDIASAILRLEVLETETLDEHHRAEARLFRGRVFELMGRTDEALELYNAGTQLRDGPIKAESQLLKTALEVRLGKADHKEAIERLERLALSWRGDDIEINALRTLGKYYVEDGNYRRAFQVLKDAVVADEGSEYTRLFQDEMSRAFVNYFLGEGAKDQAALDALALYYDFKEMTPIGRQGDEIIRRLADRLVEVDLLDQAADLLEYQIDKRLRGAARSQVAAQLAYVHLLNKAPEKALSVIQRTRQTVLPEQLQQERNLLEARALSDLGRTALASELLKIIEGPEASRLMADTLWKAKRWQEAGEHIELMLADAWQSARPLKDSERYDVLRGAVAFALSGDNLGLDRYRSKFLGKMSDSPDANAFAVVTEPINIASPDFQAVAREIADVDTLQSFLKDFRERYGYAAKGSKREPETSSTPQLERRAEAPG